jgi:hypothetical protein
VQKFKFPSFFTKDLVEVLISRSNTSGAKGVISRSNTSGVTNIIDYAAIIIFISLS